MSQDEQNVPLLMGRQGRQIQSDIGSLVHIIASHFQSQKLMQLLLLVCQQQHRAPVDVESDDAASDPR